MTLLAAALVLLQAGPPDERERWLPPLETVSLSGGKRPVPVILEAVRRQTALEIEVQGFKETEAVEVEWKDRPVLAALDDICRELGRGRVSAGWAKEGGEPPSILVDASSERPHAVTHRGRFQVEVEDIQVTIQRSLRKSERRAQVSLRLTGQPGTRPLGVGEFVAEECVDDAGWSLVAGDGVGHSMGREAVGREAGEDPSVVVFASDHRTFGRWGRSGKLSVSIRAPSDQARLIRRLTGRVAVSFPMRYVEDTVPAAHLTKGREIRIGTAAVEVVSFTQKGAEATFVYRAPRGGLPSFPNWELVDAEGEQINRGYSGSGGGRNYTMKYRLSKDVPVAGIRYKAYVGRITLIVPVELRDIPLPGREPADGDDDEGR